MPRMRRRPRNIPKPQNSEAPKPEELFRILDKLLTAAGNFSNEATFCLEEALTAIQEATLKDSSGFDDDIKAYIEEIRSFLDDFKFDQKNAQDQVSQLGKDVNSYWNRKFLPDDLPHPIRRR